MYELKKKDRLCKNREYQLVYRHGKSYVARSVVLYIMKRSPQQPIRSGFVTGKKVGCAVERNYCRHRSELISGYDLVLIGRSRMKYGTYADAEKTIMKLFKQAGLLKKA